MPYVYVASNPGLKAGLVKIGISNIRPEERLRALSKSTAAPAHFELRYSIETSHAKKVESRVHSLLEHCRFRSNREYFELDVKRASEVIAVVAEHTEFQGAIGTKIGKSDSLLSSTYSPRLSLNERKLLDLVIAATNHLIFRHVIRFPQDIVDGFLDSKTTADYLNVGNSWAATLMDRFSDRARDLHVDFLEGGERLKVFNSIQYYRGELRWLFNEHFLDHVTNNKI